MNDCVWSLSGECNKGDCQCNEYISRNSNKGYMIAKQLNDRIKEEVEPIIEEKITPLIEKITEEIKDEYLEV